MRRHIDRIRSGNVVALMGFVGFLVSALVMELLWFGALVRWVGWPGVVLGILSAPAAAAYPLIHWFVDGVVPPAGFAVWLVGVLGVVVSMGWVMGGADPPPDP